jgi:hypothetical protein
LPENISSSTWSQFEAKKRHVTTAFCQRELHAVLL